MTMWVPILKCLRTTTIILGLSNTAVIILGGVLLFVVFPGCDRKRLSIPISVVSLAAGLRILTMFKTGVAQKAIAINILGDSPSESSVVDSLNRMKRRVMYKTWLWWSRLAMVITLLQMVAAIYLVFNVAKFISLDGISSECLTGTGNHFWKRKLLIIFGITACCVPLVHCFAGVEVLRWRSFYESQDDAWRAHYEEVFDHGIREALCCLGRIKYLKVSKEDEVYSVARLLGDLVAYRASGTGHLELLAGLALLQRHNEHRKSHVELVEAPKEQIQEALTFHEFAEAAYTGPLLDFGRHTVFFPCAWLYRQGILMPWTCNRRPSLIGDNWWRGHAAAFLKYVNLPPDSLRGGRVCQEKCQAAYFIVVVHHLRSVVIAIRGTETAEDLITDGLGWECPLSREDLDGLINSSHVHPDVKRRVESSFPHYGHSGVVEAARDLYMQIEGNPAENESESSCSGFLSSLLGAGCECDGYDLRIVGHSLGGAIAAFLGIRLYRRYPNLHVYSYGPLPCMDFVIAEACSEFVTSIVHNHEFSARFSVRAILRLRAAAIMALKQDAKTDTALILRLARRFLHVSNYQGGRTEAGNPSELHSAAITVEEPDHHVYMGNKVDQSYSLWNKSERTNSSSEKDGEIFENPFYDRGAVANSSDDPVSRFLQTVPRSENGSGMDSAEMFLPGLVIHMVMQRRHINLPLWKGWRVSERVRSYRAYLANRETFKDIDVSPYMFIDHLPWRCHNAMQKVLEAQNDKGPHDRFQNV